MTTRVFPISDWAPAEEAAAPASFASAGRAAHGPGAHASPAAALDSQNSAIDARLRSVSLAHSFRPGSLATTTDYANTTSLQAAAHGRHRSGTSNLRSIVRRASTSLKVKLNLLAPSARGAPETDTHPSQRPITAHATWNRLRQAASFRHPTTSSGLENSSPYLPPDPVASCTAPLPIPSIGGEPPIIPHNTGAAAKASVAMQNEYMPFPASAPTGRESTSSALQNKWLAQLPLDECGNDRESGIGITAAGFESEADVSDSKRASLQGGGRDGTISRIDFVSELPAELAFQILSLLDAQGLAIASKVSRSWRKATSDQQIWKASFLREKTATYATTRPIQPGAGLGVPPVRPGMNWREVYRAREELDRRWRNGQAKPVYLNGHLESIYCLQFDESKLITGSRDKTIRIWDMHTYECKLVIGPPQILTNESMLVDEYGEPVHFATLANNTEAAHSRPALMSFPIYHDKSILCLQYDDEILVTGGSDATCIVHKVKSGYRPVRRLEHHTAAVLDLVFDERHIVTCSKDNSICVWSRDDGTLLRRLRGHTGPVNAVQMRGNTVVSCSGDFRVKLWNIDTGKNIREFAGHTKGLACSQFSEDGRYVASAGNDRLIRVWDANTGECVREMEAHRDLVRSMHVDSVSGRLVSGSYDRDVKVFDMETGQQLLDFPQWHASWVLGVKSDYRRIVSTGHDSKILVLDFGAGVRGIEVLESTERPPQSPGGDFV